MVTEEQKEIEGFTQFISEYNFQLSTGKLNVSAFMAYLFQCLAFDRNRQPPFLTDMQQALVDLLEQVKPRLPKGTPGLASEPVLDWQPEMSIIYPDGKAITIHLASLIQVAPEWIYAIGQMVPDRATDRGQAYLAWPRKGWHLTNTFLQKFHSEYWSTIRKLDLETSRSSKYSFIEALDLAKKLDIDYNLAVEQLKDRNTSFHSALDRVDQAIDAGFPLEAITICESLISACLHHFLTAKGETNPPEIFARLIHRFRQANSRAQHYPDKLIEEIDAWRISRNDAMHRFVSRSLMEVSKSQQEFLDDAKKTAAEGKALCAELIEWFQYESVFMLKADFDLEGSILN